MLASDDAVELGRFDVVVVAVPSHQAASLLPEASELRERASEVKMNGCWAMMLLIATGVGLVVDSTLLGLGVYRFPNESAIGMLPPLWMSALWIQFATTFRYCLKWLSGRYVFSALLGFAGAPLAFVGGENIGAVSFYSPRLSNLLVLGSLWAIAIPLLIYISDRIQADASVAATYRGFPSPEKV